MEYKINSCKYNIKNFISKIADDISMIDMMMTGKNYTIIKN